MLLVVVRHGSGLKFYANLEYGVALLHCFVAFARASSIKVEIYREMKGSH